MIHIDQAEDRQMIPMILQFQNDNTIAILVILEVNGHSQERMPTLN